MLRFRCECGRQLQAREEDVGKKARCPSCDQLTTILSEEEVPRERPRREEYQEERPRKARLRYADEEDDYDDRDRDRDRPRRRRRREEEPEPSSGKAIAALVLGLVSFLLVALPAIPAIVVGSLALRDIGRSNGRLSGKGLAFTGLISASLSILIWGTMGLFLLRAVPRVTEAAARVRGENNLKQLGLAMHNHHDAKGTLPAAAAYRTKDGKPGLSWRVALLPYIGEDQLFRQFKLDEPWDSPNNKPLLARMPQTYGMPDQANDGTGFTYYQVLVGPGTMFEERKGLPPGLPASGIRITDVTDGLSNTIMITTGRTPVLWTKPDDLPFNPMGALPPMGGTLTNGYNVMLGDGSLRFIPPGTPEEKLKAMITRNGGEVINWP